MTMLEHFYSCMVIFCCTRLKASLKIYLPL